ncbi:MAG: Helix-turn-helix, AraC protein [Gemmatimonadetes bacterium]|nr:Helix-turn-helix, AraC protein [Gemmatimonadota bacterium]
MPPSPGLPFLIALIRDRREAALFRGALGARGTIEFVESAAALESLAGQYLEDVGSLIIEPVDAQGTAVAPSLLRLRAAAATLPIVAWCEAGHEFSQTILALAQAGVDDLLFRHVDEPQAVLRLALQRAGHSRHSSEILDAILPHIPRPAWAIVEYAVKSATETLDLEAMARTMGVSRATLFRICRAQRIPPPRELIGWSRLLMVGARLRGTSRSVEQIAYDLAFPSPNALRALLTRYLGMRPQDLRAAGGLQPVVDAFVRELNHPSALAEDAEAASA